MKRLFTALFTSIILCTGMAAWAVAPTTTEMTFDNASSSYVSDFASFGSIFENGVKSFAFDLPTTATNGIYHVTANFGGSGINVDWTKSNLNGAVGSPVFTGAGVDFGFITTNSAAPFVLSIFGTEVGAFHALGGHIDAFLTSPVISAQAAPVPEPENYAMFLAGLGVIGTIAVRRSK